MEEYPTYQFSSTSSSSTVYTGSGLGGVSTRPTIGNEGTAEMPSFSSPARAGATPGHSHYDRNRDGRCDVCGITIGSNAGTPGGQVNPDKQIPVGDAVLPLLLMVALLVMRKWMIGRVKRS